MQWYRAAAVDRFVDGPHILFVAAFQAAPRPTHSLGRRG